MPNVTEIKAALEGLPDTERVALFHWLEQNEAVRADKLASLREAVAEGYRDEAEGRYLVLESDEDFDRLRAELRQGISDLPKKSQ